MTSYLDRLKRLSPEELTHFQDEGYVILKNFIDSESARTLKGWATDDQVISENTFERKDADGRTSKVTLWYDPGEDVFGRLSRSDKLIDAMSECLGGQACFFHAKLMQKEAKSGGAWEWHQDYGYWYDDGFLTDDLASCYIALDKATTENGCLIVIPRSHKYGRIRHVKIGEQTGADLDRVAILEERHQLVQVELDPGDAVFFHSNLLHSSQANTSEHSRWGMISTFFRSDNESIVDDERFKIKSLQPVPHEEVLQGAQEFGSERRFLH